MNPKITKLYKLVAEAATRGYRIKPGSYFETEAPFVSVCLCGAVLKAMGIGVPQADDDLYGGNNGEATIRLVAQKLGITVTQAGSLNNGFEGVPRRNKEIYGASSIRMNDGVDDEWYTVGKAFRRAWQKNGASRDLAAAD